MTQSKGARAGGCGVGPDLPRRMAFNVMARNCDDHTKNFAFRLKERAERVPNYQTSQRNVRSQPYSPEAGNQEAERANLRLMSIDKRFPRRSESHQPRRDAERLADVKESAGYVAIERASGALHGRDGIPVLQHTGTMTRGVPQLSVPGVPDSASGDLSGLSGSMIIKTEAGKHSYEFDYTIPEAATGLRNVHTVNESHDLAYD
jgi:Protein of unknown function (DUF3224)